MFRCAKPGAFKIIAGILVVLMLLSMIPVSTMFQAFAVEVETFTVKMPENVSATVTMTDENNAENVFTADTNDNFKAVFKNLDSETTYTLVVSGMKLYKKYTKTGVAVSDGATVEILTSSLTEKGTQNVTWAEDAVEKKFGDASFNATVNTFAGAGQITYSSSNTGVATIGANNGLITIAGVGTTEITLTAAATDDYKLTTDSFTLTVVQGKNAISYATTMVNWTVKDVKTNIITVKSGAEGTITYASDNQIVASVNEITGEVTVLKTGTAKITATFTAKQGGNYKDSTAFYTINATKKSDVLKYEAAEITKTYGNANGTNELTKPDDITGTITYESSNTNVATVDANTGEYTIVGAGTTTITATLADDDDNYEADDASYTLVVDKIADALSFDEKSQTYTYGESGGVNELTIAHEDLGGFKGSVKYTSNKTSVVSVNETTGKIKVLKPGTATITASIVEEDNYKAASASYTVVVNKKKITITINKSINYGEDDPDLSTDIAEGVEAGLISSEKDDTDIINRVVSKISYTYPAVAEGELRPEGNYDITFTTEADDYYAFNLSGTLKVENNYDAQDLYIIEGLNDNNWGSEKNKVVIKVTDENRYRISKTNKRFDAWDATELVYDTAEKMSEHTFYIRDMQTPGKQKVSKAIKVTFGIDGTAPTIEGFSFGLKGDSSTSKTIYYLSFGAFCKEEVELQVTANDPVKDSETNDVSGVRSVKLYYNGDIHSVSAVKGNIAKFTLTLEQFAQLKTIAAIAIDNVGNTPTETDGNEKLTYADSKNSGLGDGQWNGLLQLEQNPPTITVEYPDPVHTIVNENGEEKWYGDNVTFKATVTDLGDTNSGIRSVWAKINGVEVSLSEFSVNPDNNEPGDKIYYFISGESKVSELSFEFDTSLVAVPAKPSGKYEIEVFACDNAGTIVKYDNVTETAITDTDEASNIVINIDRDAPVVTSFEFKAESGIEGDSQPAATMESYGYFFKQDTQVVVTAKDERPSAGVKHIEFYTVTKEGVRKDYEASSTFTDASNADTVIVSATFTVTEGFKGQIYARAIDNVDHTTIDEEGNPIYFNPNGAAIENSETHKKHSNATIDLVDTTEYKDADGLPLYKWAEDGDDTTPDGVPVKLYVQDTFSGIKSIDWEVVAPYNATESDPKGNITIDSYLDSTVAVGDDIDGWTVEAVDNNLVTEMSTVIYVTNNSNNIVVNLSFTDRAGNKSDASCSFSIDNSAPFITVEMNDNDDADYAGFFKTNRKFKVSVFERNFNNNVTFDVTRDGKNVTITPDFKVVMDGEKPKSSVFNGLEFYTYEWESEFADDGDYTFSVSAVDIVGNAISDDDVDYGEAKEICKAFTIDQTLPKIDVSYDNNNAANGKYFNKSRTATVTIEEHNFDINRVDFGGITASLNGANINTPEIEWAHDDEHDIHIAKIAFKADGDYTFDVEVTDKAGNDNDGINFGKTVAGKDFVVDQTIVKPTIGGIKNGGAYKENVIPTVSFTDVNYDYYEIKLVRTRKDEKNIDVTKEFIKNIAEQDQGFNGTFDTFKKTVENDGIYTLTVRAVDKAGNNESQKYTFTVNRFGSVYVYNEYLSALIKDGGQYVTSIEDDLVITEYNADKLLEGSLKILITCDGEAVDVDFTSSPEINEMVGIGESGWYQYVYTIKHTNFKKDGVYKISLSSEYSADDSAKNESTSVPDNSTKENGEAVVDAMNFTVDSVAPEIRNIVNLDKKIADIDKIIDGKLNVKYTIVDVGGLKTIEVILNGKTIQTVTEKELAESAFNYIGSFDIAEQDGITAHKIQIVATDLAGNVTDTNSKDFLVAHSDDNEDSTYVFFNEVTVSRNFFVRFYANKGLFWGSIAGVIVLVGAIWFIIAAKKKKKENN